MLAVMYTTRIGAQAPTATMPGMASSSMESKELVLSHAALLHAPTKNMSTMTRNQHMKGVCFVVVGS